VYTVSALGDDAAFVPGVTLSLPCILGREGVMGTLAPALDPGEHAALVRGAEILKQAASELGYRARTARVAATYYTRTMPTRRVPDELHEMDEELDLPPLDADGDEGDETNVEGGIPDLLDEEGLDDADATDLDVGDDELDTGEEEDDDSGDEIDVGAIDEGIVIDEASAEPGEPDGVDDDDGRGVDDMASEDDGGAEGTDEDPGDEVDESALPELDDDDGDAEENDTLAEVLLAEADTTIPWAAARWAPLEGAGAELPCRAVAAAGGRVAAAGEVLLLIEEGARAARRAPFAEGSVAVALGDDALLAASARGQLLLARDGGADATAIGSWRAGVEPSLGLWPAEGGAPVELAATPGRFWIRAGAALLCSTSPEQPIAAVRDRGVLAITASAGVLVALTSGAAGVAIERFRGDDEGWAETPLAGDALQMAERDRGAVRLSAAAGGRAVALCDHRRVAVSRDGGATFAMLEPGAALAVAFAGEGAEAPLLVLLAPTAAGGAAVVVEIDASGSAVRVGEIAAPEREITAAAGSPWATAALAWDTTRDVVWVASGAGLVALGRPRRH